MSVKAMNWVWEHSRAKGNNLLVMLAIADRANDDGEDAWPSNATLQRKTKLSESTIRRCIQALEKTVKELEVRRGKGPGGTNTYRIRFEARLPIFEPASPARTAPQAIQSDTRQNDTPSIQSDTRQYDAGVTALKPGGVAAAAEVGVSAVTPNTSSTPNTSLRSTSGAHDAPQSDEPDDAKAPVRQFIAWFCDTFKVHQQAKYFVQAKRDIPLARTLLKAYGLESLQAMALLLVTVRGDQFIDSSDRGIGILSVKASWLAGRVAAQQPAASKAAWVCRHLEPCSNRSMCEQATFLNRPTRATA